MLGQLLQDLGEELGMDLSGLCSTNVAQNPTALMCKAATFFDTLGDLGPYIRAKLAHMEAVAEWEEAKAVLASYGPAEAQHLSPAPQQAQLQAAPTPQAAEPTTTPRTNPPPRAPDPGIPVSDAMSILF